MKSKGRYDTPGNTANEEGDEQAGHEEAKTEAETVGVADYALVLGVNSLGEKIVVLRHGLAPSLTATAIWHGAVTLVNVTAGQVAKTPDEAAHTHNAKRGRPDEAEKFTAAHFGVEQFLDGFLTLHLAPLHTCYA